MSGSYQIVALTSEEENCLLRARDDLMALAGCDVPAVSAAARAALAQIEQALNGQGLAYELYTAALTDRQP
jgi:hypothetical protein